MQHLFHSAGRGMAFRLSSEELVFFWRRFLIGVHLAGYFQLGWAQPEVGDASLQSGWLMSAELAVYFGEVGRACNPLC